MAKKYKNLDLWSTIIIFSLIVLDLAIWNTIIKDIVPQTSRVYFFDVAQGSSEFIVLPGNIKIMVDAGGDDKIVSEIDSALSSANDRYIDLAIISYPQINNYGGYGYILDHYRVGAFLYDGRNDVSYTKEWQQFLSILQSKNIPLITLGAGDSINYNKSVITILSPDDDFARSADISDAGLVEQVRVPEYTVLLASDIGEHVGKYLLSNSKTIKSDILKIPYPLVIASSGNEFLAKIAPRIEIISPGTKNTASAPVKAMVAGMVSSTKAAVLQTSVSGMVTISTVAGKLEIIKGK